MATEAVAPAVMPDFSALVGQLQQVISSQFDKQDKMLEQLNQGNQDLQKGNQDVQNGQDRLEIIFNNNQEEFRKKQGALEDTQTELMQMHHKMRSDQTLFHSDVEAKIMRQEEETEKVKKEHANTTNSGGAEAFRCENQNDEARGGDREG